MLIVFVQAPCLGMFCYSFCTCVSDLVLFFYRSHMSHGVVHVWYTALLGMFCSHVYGLYYLSECLMNCIFACSI